MNWVRSNTKDGVANLGALYGRAWYQQNTAGNCNNGNCNCNCVTMGLGNCGDGNCTACQCNTSNCNCGGPSAFNCIIGTINCTNCDTRAWLQPNCNCACTYNCAVTGAWYPNCNCNSCFTAGCRVLMADFTWKRVETLRGGDIAMGPKGPVEICGVDVGILGPEHALLSFDGAEHSSLTWVDGHTFWARKQEGPEWLWSYSPDHWRHEVTVGAIGGLKDNHSLLTGDVEFANVRNGFVQREIVEHVRPDPLLPIFFPRTSGSPIIVEGYVVGAGINEANYDYSQIEWLKDYLPIKQALENTR